MKKFLYFLIPLLIIALYYSFTTFNDQPFKNFVQSINGEDIFPYEEEISPKIGIIDTGVSISNSFIPSENIEQLTIEDTLTKTSEQIHGTMIAGIILGNGTKSSEPKGLLPQSNILSIQTGTDYGTTSENLAKAIELAIEHKVKILNISLATSQKTEVLKTAVEKALEEDIIIIAAAGNDGGDNEYFPADFDGVVSVGSVDLEGIPIGDTNLKTVDIFAPGSDIITTVPGSQQKAEVLASNSVATPVVTSLVAVLLDKYPSLSSDEIKEILTLTSKRKKIKNEDTIYIMDVDKALESANH